MSVYYGDYLNVSKLTNLQAPESLKYGEMAHDEMLFIVIHQTYELWFKQILFELDSIQNIFKDNFVENRNLLTVLHRTERICEILKILNSQMDVMETMTSLDFMDFRDYLNPASGFQSIQFRLMETKLGLTYKKRTLEEKKFFNTRLNDQDKKRLAKELERKSLLELLENWLERMPFAEMKGFDFWDKYKEVIDKSLDQDLKTIKSNETLSDFQKTIEMQNLISTRDSFKFLFDHDAYESLLKKNEAHLSRKALLNSIFIFLYRDEPILQVPFKILDQMVELDELITTWRYRHAIMAHRILGKKIGTGGSSGHDYLKKSAENNRIYTDLFNLATFLIPRSKLPKLPEELTQKLGLQYEAGRA